MEFVYQYRSQLVLPDGTRYVARVYTDLEVDGTVWEAWLVFFPLTGGEALATDRETSQSKREDVDYWASGIEPVYLEGALVRALSPPGGRLARHAVRDERYVEAERAVYRADAAGVIVQARQTETGGRAA